MWTRLSAIGIVAIELIAMTLAMWSGDPVGAPRVAQAQTTPTVTIDTFQFKLRDLEIKEGTKVLWGNEDDAQHTVTSGTPETRTDLFNTAIVHLCKSGQVSVNKTRR